ncbi:MAG: isoprenylcysteine carboxylmethyltransferase family protein [Pyrinomonadaceae bacterium]|nr:isoprenylcysteine carboxylmethyltransferase family protein [Deltaproteobacteria bacterium]MDM7921061.1 isoprenylcysteine carboxylmethyltransferase family protein [Pyrinomonadaceae bacterium]
MDRYTLLIYLIVYLTVAFVLPTYRVWKRTGSNPVTFGGTDSAHDYVGTLFKVVMLIVFLAIGARALLPGVDEFLMPIFWLEFGAAQYVGYILLVASLIWVVTAQLQMGDSWRIGIDPAKTRLVSTGLFGVSRNPIFLGMMGTLLGLVLVLPNAFTLTSFALGFALMQIQVRLEEEFLRRSQEGKYEEYANRVRRWL